MWVLLTVDPDDLTGVKGSLAGRFADTSAFADRSNDVLRSSHSDGCIPEILEQNVGVAATHRQDLSRFLIS